MSQSRLNKSSSRTRSYLQQPIEYRKVMLHRSDHHSTLSPSQLDSSRRPTESRLERLINLDHSQPPSRLHAHQFSLSNSQAARRDNRTPVEHLNNSKITSLPKNASLTALQQQQQYGTPARVEVSQQKLSLKQQNRQSASPSPFHSIEDITERMNFLVNKKLQLMFDALHGKGGEVSKQREVNAELQDLLVQMRKMETMKGSDMHLLNQKITFIETLMAEQNAEVEMMKKHYYNLSSNKIKGKVGDFTHNRTKIAQAYKSLRQHSVKAKQPLPKHDYKKPLFKETTNKSSYKQPKSQDYESYRYRHRLAPVDPQPLPRSSYKRDFLVLKSQPDEKIINRDHSPYYPSSKARVGSTYGQDYRKLKTETIDHRQLDAFRNKIRTIKVSYMPQRRSVIEPEDKLYREAVSMSRVRSNISQNRPSEHDITFNKKMLQSESKREFQGECSYQPSRIKHQQLQSFQYKLKQLFKV